MTRSRAKVFSALWEGTYDEMMARRQSDSQASEEMDELDEDALNLLDEIFSYS
jgi:hypothetical protein